VTGVRRAERKTMSFGCFWRMFLAPFWRKADILEDCYVLELVGGSYE
jgi:hypothetical protein